MNGHDACVRLGRGAMNSKQDLQKISEVRRSSASRDRDAACTKEIASCAPPHCLRAPVWICGSRRLPFHAPEERARTSHVADPCKACESKNPSSSAGPRCRVLWSVSLANQASIPRSCKRWRLWAPMWRSIKAGFFGLTYVRDS